MTDAEFITRLKKERENIISNIGELKYDLKINRDHLKNLMQSYNQSKHEIESTIKSLEKQVHELAGRGAWIDGLLKEMSDSSVQVSNYEWENIIETWEDEADS